MAFRYRAARSLSYVARICNRSPQAIYTSQKWLCSAPAGSSLDEPGMKDCSFQVQVYLKTVKYKAVYFIVMETFGGI